MCANRQRVVAGEEREVVRQRDEGLVQCVSLRVALGTKDDVLTGTHNDPHLRERIRW